MASSIRLCSFMLKSAVKSNLNHTTKVGIVYDNGEILDLTKDHPMLYKVNNMHDIIEKGDEYVKTLKSIISSSSLMKSSLIPQSDIKLLAPIPRPHRNVMCVGKNYLDHIHEVKIKDAKSSSSSSSSSSAVELPKYAQFFTKAPDCVIGPHDVIESHSNITKYLDYEAELAIVIGKPGRDILSSSAMKHIYGYIIANDVTARDLQRHHNQWFKGKSLDSTCPMGPYLIPSCEIADVHDMDIMLKLNDVMMQKSNTKKMIFDVKAIVCQLSRGFTLKTGDVILTGTPEGVGYARNPPVMLKAGDKISITISGLGCLENHVV